VNGTGSSGSSASSPADGSLAAPAAPLPGAGPACQRGQAPRKGSGCLGPLLRRGGSAGTAADVTAGSSSSGNQARAGLSGLAGAVGNGKALPSEPEQAPASDAGSVLGAQGTSKPRAGSSPTARAPTSDKGIGGKAASRVCRRVAPKAPGLRAQPVERRWAVGASGPADPAQGGQGRLADRNQLGAQGRERRQGPAGIRQPASGRLNGRQRCGPSSQLDNNAKSAGSR